MESSGETSLTKASEYLRFPPPQPLLTRLSDSVRKRGVGVTLGAIGWSVLSRLMRGGSQEKTVADHSSLGNSLKDRAWNREAERFDKRHHVRTAGWIEAKDLKDVGPQVSSASDYVVMRPLRLMYEVLAQPVVEHERFTFIDFGSGMGRSALSASDYPFREIVGVEYSPELHAIAEANIRSYRNPAQKCFHIKSVCVSAEEFPLPDGDLFVALFNPFGPAVMEPLLRNLERAVSDASRDVWIVYGKPKCGYLFDGSRYFEKVSESLLVDYWYSIYRSIAPAR